MTHTETTGEAVLPRMASERGHGLPVLTPAHHLPRCAADPARRLREHAASMVADDCQAAGTARSETATALEWGDLPEGQPGRVVSARLAAGVKG